MDQTDQTDVSASSMGKLPPGKTSHQNHVHLRMVNPGASVDRSFEAIGRSVDQSFKGSKLW